MIEIKATTVKAPNVMAAFRLTSVLLGTNLETRPAKKTAEISLAPGCHAAITSTQRQSTHHWELPIASRETESDMEKTS